MKYPRDLPPAVRGHLDQARHAARRLGELLGQRRTLRQAALARIDLEPAGKERLATLVDADIAKALTVWQAWHRQAVQDVKSYCDGVFSKPVRLDAPGEIRVESAARRLLALIEADPDGASQTALQRLREAADVGDVAMLVAARRELPDWFRARGEVPRFDSFSKPLVPDPLLDDLLKRHAVDGGDEVLALASDAEQGFSRIGLAIDLVREELTGKGEADVLPGWGRDDLLATTDLGEKLIADHAADEANAAAWAAVAEGVTL